MTLKVFSTAPYYDDYDEDKKYLRMLFRAGVSLQVRELNQLQTYLQTQIERLGLHLFKDGAMVVPGQSAVDTGVTYLKVEANTNAVDIDTIREQLVGSILIGANSGVTAKVIATSGLTTTDPVTLFVQYTKSSDDAQTRTFDPSEILVTETGTTVNGLDYTVQIQVGTTSVGLGSLASIQRGIYFVKGQFALVDSKIIILDKYSNAPSYRIGLSISENIITPNLDTSLNDNSNGTPNANAPGAHRYQMLLDFTALPITSTTDSNFIELIRVENGRLQSKVDTTTYNELAKTLARRTYDESGDYAITPFKVGLREHRNNDRGVWKTSTAYLIGDIVRSGNNYFTALNSGTSGSTEPSTIFSATNPYQQLNDGIVKWNYTTNPAFNRGFLTPEKGGNEGSIAVACEPGKAYVQGYAIEKIATEYVEIPKARDFDRISSDSIPTKFGNYVYVSNVRGSLDCSTYPVVKLYNQTQASVNPQNTPSSTLVGTARLRAIENAVGTPGTSTTGIYSAFLFNVEMVSGYSFTRDVKQLFIDTGSTVTNFVADVAAYTTDTNGNYVDLTGSITASATTLTGSGTLFTTQLKVNDYIRIVNSSNAVEIRRITAISSNTSATIDSAFSGTVSGVAYKRIQATINEPNGMSLIFPLAQPYVRKVRGGDNDTVFGTSYTTTQKFTGTASSTTLGISLSQAVNPTTLAVEFNPSASKNSYIVIDTTAGSNGVLINPTAVTITNNGLDLTISGVTSGHSYIVLAPVRKSGSVAKEKKKTLQTNQTIDFASLTTVTPTTLSLAKADAYRIVSIRMSPAGDWTASSNPSTTTDITDWFTFDNGQRDTHYGVATITRKSGYPIPSGAVRVIFDYFDHTIGTAGDYFTVDSYLDVPYDSIPYFASSNGVFCLADVVDFRPRMADDGSGFVNGGSSRTEVPKIGFETISSYSYYLSRKDKLAVDIDGKFFSALGISALNPQEPKNPSLGMLIAKLNVEPYTLSANNGSITVEAVDNKRYTMNDIGKLDKRIQNLEYYTALSLLEQETKSLTIRDEYNLERFKSGFIVDSFKGQDVGDVTSVDYRCSIDMSAKELRPGYVMKNVNLIEENQINADRITDGYTLTGDIVTLPYTHQKLIDQPYASRTENINPFAIFTFLGTTVLNPSVDEWFETEYRPDIISNVEGNFSAIAAGGLITTVWGAWETAWVGQTVVTGESSSTSVSSSSSTRSLGTSRWVGIVFGTRNEVTTTTTTTTSVLQTLATDVGQTRSGFTRTVVPRTDYEITDDKLVDTSVIPFIRKREVLFVCKALKPNTRLYPFFDDTDISAYIQPATRISVVNTSTIPFDTETNAGNAAQEFARQLNGKAEPAYSSGDIVYVKQRGSTTYNSHGVSPATAVVVLTEKDVDGNEAIYVMNIKGTFQQNDTIGGSLSGAIYTINAPITPAISGDRLITNFNGSVAGVFSIPNSDSVRFRTGIREFKLTDSSAGGLDYTTETRGRYRAEGTLHTRQRSVNAIRNADVVITNITESRTIQETSSRSWSSSSSSSSSTIGWNNFWVDPLAQTFLVQSSGGAFITKLDLYFATKDTNIPVQVQIREVVNGYPGHTIVPFSSTILMPEQVNVSATASVPTQITFKSPIYLMDNTEYCIVLISDSNNYRVWISQLGEKSVGTDRFISEQPYAGVLFKSQNASTWTANQEQDLKFSLYRAKFDTSVQGAVTLVNEPIPPSILRTNPFKTTSGSKKVRVYHSNHGMQNGGSVIITNVLPATYNGIVTTSNTGLNGTFTISNVEYDSYIIEVATNATLSGFVGGTSIIVTENIGMDALNVVTQSQTFSDTSLGYSVITTNTQNSVGTTEESFVPTETLYFDDPRMVLSQINENNAIGGQKSLKVIARMSSNNDALSPVIDTARFSAIAIKNKVDNFTQSTKNVAVVDDVTIINAIAGFTFNYVASTGIGTISVPSGSQTSVRNLLIGKYITISGGTNVNGTYLVTGVTDDGSVITIAGVTNTTTETPATSTIVMKDNYISEIAPTNGSSVGKYITRMINFQNASTFLRIMFAANVPAVSDSDVEVWYKLIPSGTNGDINLYNFTKASTATKPIVKTSNKQQFTDVQYEIPNLPAFDSVVVKLVFKSGNSAQVPRVKDLRIIACA